MFCLSYSSMLLSCKVSHDEAATSSLIPKTNEESIFLTSNLSQSCPRISYYILMKFCPLSDRQPSHACFPTTHAHRPSILIVAAIPLVKTLSITYELRRKISK